jgi:sulfite exporter TauE/SafE
MQNVNLFTIFVTGLVTGGLSCLAVQGGLLASCLASRVERNEGQPARNDALPILTFLTSKLVAYTILGFLLGSLGSVMQLSLTAKVVMQFAVVIFMIGTALNMLDVHPIFRYFVIQPPRFLTRMIRNRAKSADMFAPAILGAATVFIPCGTTQAMMALAIATGQPVLSAAIMAAFILGTSPVFFTLGFLTAKLGDTMHAVFMKVAAVAIIGLALFNLDGALALSGSQVTIGSSLRDAYCTISVCRGSSSAINTTPSTDVTIVLSDIGYSPAELTIPKGEKITLHLKNDNARGCIQAFTIPSLSVQELVRTGSTRDVTFTAPATAGDLPFMCSMGMYRGTFKVI